ncbi:MAG: DMT family transporter [Gammaproteobacteria bacterium]|nr:DMT family transporter [Gammaproteobacteria bacterium]
MTAAARAQVQIHCCVLLWGFTAIFGRLISLPAAPLVWWRMVIVVAALALVPRVWRALNAMPPRRRWAYAGIGVLVALHWLTFYGAIKLANASVGATCIAFATVLIALIEPVLTRRRFAPRELLLGVAVLPGVALVVGGVPQGMRLGIVVGALSALLVAVFGSLNKRLVHDADALAVTALELGAGTLALTLLGPALLPLFGASGGGGAAGASLLVLPGTADAVYLLVLALACTLLPFALSLVALRHMSAFSAQLAVNLEPIYAILLAMLLLGEQRELTPQFYAGVVIILAVVFAHPLTARARRLDHPEVLGTAEARQIVD